MSINRLTTLAFSLYSNKGAYAVLLGSGILLRMKGNLVHLIRSISRMWRGRGD